MELRGARCLLTGASSGIGRSLALQLADRGVELAISARRVPMLEALVDEIAHRGGVRPVILPADLRRRGAATDLAQQALDRLGRVDVVVSNAGAGLGGSQWAGGDSNACRDLFETNLWAPLALTAALVPQMRARGSGAIVNVTSMGKFIPLPLLGHYTATKAALAVATETLRLELRGSGVCVLEIVPGLIETPMLQDLRRLPGVEKGVRRGPKGSPKVLARLTIRALEAGQARLVYPRAASAIHILPALGRAAAAQMRPDLEEHGDLLKVESHRPGD